jgi:hypothetical protein
LVGSGSRTISERFLPRALQVGSEDGFDPADPGKTKKGVRLEGKALAVEAEGFEGGIESEFVQVAEGIDNAALRAVDAKGMA